MAKTSKYTVKHLDIAVTIEPDGDGCFRGSFKIGDEKHEMFGGTTQEVEFRCTRTIDKRVGSVPKNPGVPGVL